MGKFILQRVDFLLSYAQPKPYAVRHYKRELGAEIEL
jgi:hypothetical protein